MTSMSAATRARLAVILTAVTVAIFVAFGVIYLTPITPHAVSQSAGGPTTAAFVMPFSLLALVGGVIAARRPDNRMGWVILAAGGCFAIGALSSLIGSELYYAHNPAGAWIALGGLFWVPGVSPASFALALALLSFPDGRLPARWWRWVLYVSVVFMLLDVAIVFVDPAPGLNGIGYTSAVNPASPVGVAGLAGIANAYTNSPINSIAQFDLEGAAVLSIFLRLRGADSERRHQIRWFATGAALSVVAIGATGAVPNPGTAGPGAIALVVTLALIGTLALPIATGVAVLKYHLYDIDVVISRAVVYGSLAVFITAIYVGIAVGVGEFLGGGGKPNLALSIVATAIVAVGFQPLRERLQRVANRLVYGRRATPYQALAEFSAHVAASYATDDVLPRMARVLAEATGAQRADVWVRDGESLHMAASWPEGAAARDHIGVDALTERHGDEHFLPLQHAGALLGALSVTKRPGEGLTPVEQHLLADLATQAGIALANVRLAADLQERVDELRGSRQRLVAAQDRERRRIERNLHDGAQQHLVALKVKLGLATMLAGRDAEKAKATITQLKGDADEALETLRDLARGIYPPLLAERGLATALEAQARKATLPVGVEANGVGRYDHDVEAAVYFCVLEALQNVQKYAHAATACVSLSGGDGTLRVAVSDDGDGFDVEAARRAGSGLTNMADRIAVIGGELGISSARGQGSRLTISVPTLAPVRVAAG